MSLHYFFLRHPFLEQRKQNYLLDIFTKECQQPSYKNSSKRIRGGGEGGEGEGGREVGEVVEKGGEVIEGGRGVEVREGGRGG